MLWAKLSVTSGGYPSLTSVPVVTYITVQGTHQVRIYKPRGLGDDGLVPVKAASPHENMRQGWTESLHPLPLPPLEMQATTRVLLVQSRSCLSCVQCISGSEIVLDTGDSQSPLQSILDPWPVVPE